MLMSLSKYAEFIGIIQTESIFNDCSYLLRDVLSWSQTSAFYLVLRLCRLENITDVYKYLD